MRSLQQSWLQFQQLHRLHPDATFSTDGAFVVTGRGLSETTERAVLVGCVVTPFFPAKGTILLLFLGGGRFLL